MTNFPDIQAQVQVAHWGWDIAVFLWLVGLAGMGTLAYFWVRKACVAWMALVTVTLGLLVVFSHLSRWWNVPIAGFFALINWSFNWSSWMMIGMVLLSVQFVVALALVAHHFEPVRRFPVLAESPPIVAAVKWLAAFSNSNLALAVTGGFGVFVTAYSGFLLTQAVGVPLWNTSLLPILWVFSAGVAVVALLELFHLAGWVDASAAKAAMKVGLAADSVKLLMIGAFVYVGLSASSAGARAGAAELLTGSLAPLLWLGVIGAGILVPLGVGLYTLNVRKHVMLVMTAAVFGLLGGLLLRGAVLMAGKFDTLVF